MGVNVGVAVGVGVGVGVDVGVFVGVGVGVKVGPSNSPGPQLESNKLATKEQIVMILCFPFIVLPRCHGRTRQMLGELLAVER